MLPYQWTIVGLVLDIIGAFLLAVEAIRLENLRRLGRRLSRVFPLLMNSKPSPFETRLQMILGVAAVLILTIWVANEFGFSPSTLLPSLVDYATQAESLHDAIRRLLGIALLVLLLATVWLPLGVFLQGVLLFATWASLEILDFIDRNTPTGTIGSVGFLLLFLGFGFQVYAAWLGAHRSSP